MWSTLPYWFGEARSSQPSCPEELRPHATSLPDVVAVRGGWLKALQPARLRARTCVWKSSEPGLGLRV